MMGQAYTAGVTDTPIPDRQWDYVMSKAQPPMPLGPFASGKFENNTNKKYEISQSFPNSYG